VAEADTAQTRAPVCGVGLGERERRYGTQANRERERYVSQYGTQANIESERGRYVTQANRERDRARYGTQANREREREREVLEVRFSSQHRQCT